MGRHIAATCKLCRREKEKLFLKGDKCTTEKCPFARRPFAPGQHGKLPVRSSEYGVRLREKQKARRIYGLTERQFEKYFDEASKGKGATGDKLLEFLERRLDNVVFRLGFAASRQRARQIVHHGGVLVNGRKVDVPSFQVSADDQIKFSLKIVPLVKAMIEKSPDHTPPAWLVRSGAEEGKMASIPKREEIDAALEDHLIVEYYSR